MWRVVASLSLSFTVVATAATPTAVDREFTSTAPLTAAGSKDTLSVHITGAKTHAPYKWTLAIQDERGRERFRLERDDAWLDAFFADAGYVANCAGYEACKAKYYYSDLPAAIFNGTRPSETAWLTEKWQEANLRDTATDYLEKKAVPPALIKRAISEMKSTLSKSGYRPLIVPLSSVKADPPRIWVNSVSDFVPFYRE